MRRRDFITLIGGAAAAWPLTAFGKTQRIAIVSDSFPVSKMTEANGDSFSIAFFKELRRHGYVEGQNLLIERYSGEGRAARYPDLVREVVRSNPDLICAVANEITLDFKAATTTIPIVGSFSNPVEAGIVPSLARPGGNITGVSVSINADDHWGKRWQLLRELVPHLTKVAVLDTRRMRDGWEALIPELSRRWSITYVGPPLNFPINEAEYRRVFASIVQGGADGMQVSDEVENTTNAKVIAELAERSRLPAIYPIKLFLEAGGLMSHGFDNSAHAHDLADIVGQMLKGAKPSDIPVRQATKFELVINLKAAKALGLTVPATLLATADEVIE
jgi:putative tryptophan/tyrosine transport system substrate-binding protein